MIINYNPKKIKEFSQMLLSHPFNEYQGLTKTYRAFEAPNLDEELKMILLKKLNVSNPVVLPSFAQFWTWIRRYHGMKLATQFCEFLYPKEDPDYQKNLNRMRAKQTHAFWNHIKARVYKKWCSIITEAQCTYAVLRGVNKYGLNWQVLSNAQLDAVGIDLVIITDNETIPLQIKKDTNSPYAVQKKNNSENLFRFKLGYKANKVLSQELTKCHVNQPIALAMVLKYALPEAGKFPYDYLGVFENGFVYFKGEPLIKTLYREINQCEL